MTIFHSLLVDIMGIYYSKDCCEMLYTYMYRTRVTSLPRSSLANEKRNPFSSQILLYQYRHTCPNATHVPVIKCCDEDVTTKCFLL